ncbi:MAG: hypothetical protein LBJ74_02455 [Heliobacteriaceae bacterium]|jgi:hypothetical protein|nr:hypothetical protein [Heliobacteriaceae bacterium]
MKILAQKQKTKKGITPLFNLSPYAPHVVDIGLGVPVAVAIVEILLPT